MSGRVLNLVWYEAKSNYIKVPLQPAGLLKVTTGNYPNTFFTFRIYCQFLFLRKFGSVKNIIIFVNSENQKRLFNCKILQLWRTKTMTRKWRASTAKGSGPVKDGLIFLMYELQEEMTIILPSRKAASVLMTMVTTGTKYFFTKKISINS